MNRRRFGRTGWEINPVGYGAWQIGGEMFGPVEERQARAAIDAALESGVDFFDTALVYGDGRSERLLGKGLDAAGMREAVRVATKVPPQNMEWPARADVPLREVFPAEWIRECCETSLRNLRDHPIDLLQLHVWTDAWVDETEWFEALQRLRTEGKIRAFGVSANDHEPDAAVQVVRSGRIDSVQVIYNVFDDSPEDALFPAALENDVAVIARVPFDEGSLTGALRADTRFPRGDMRNVYFKGDRLSETVRRVEALRPILETPDQTLTQGALRFCLSHPAVSVVIPGSANPRHIAENAEAGSMGALDEEVREALREHAWRRNFYP